MVSASTICGTSEKVFRPIGFSSEFGWVFKQSRYDSKQAGSLAVVLAVCQLGLGRARASNVLPTTIPACVTLNTDYAVAGVGGMRWNNNWQTGSRPASAVITMPLLPSGVNLPTGGGVTKAYLYWFVVTPASDPFLAGAFINSSPTSHPYDKVAYSKAMVFDNHPIPDANIFPLGVGYGNNWPGSLSPSESLAFRADVTEWVSSPTGVHTLTGFPQLCEGASLVIFYRDTDGANNRDLYLFEGNDSNAGEINDPNGWDVLLSGFTYLNNGAAKLQLHIGDTQNNKLEEDVLLDGDLFLPNGPRWNGDTVPSADGAYPTGFDYSGLLWDIVNVSGFQFQSHLFKNGLPVNPRMTSVQSQDFFNLVLAIVDLPSAGGDCTGNPPPPNGLPVVNCQGPTDVEANILTGLPSVTVSATVSDPEGDDVIVRWSYRPSSGAISTVLFSETVPFEFAGQQKVISFTPAPNALLPRANQEIIVSVDDRKPGHGVPSCSIAVQTIEAWLPVIDPGALVSAEGDTITGGANLPDFRSSYAVQGNPNDGQILSRVGITDPATVVAWDNHSRTVQRLSLTQSPGAGIFYPVGTHQVLLVVTDEALNSKTAIKTFVVSRAPGNRRPVATDDESFARPGETVNISVLANDSDVDADPIQLMLGTSFSTGFGGTATVNSDRTISYSAPVLFPAEFGGTDTFPYTIQDEPPGTESSLDATATVRIRISFVNVPPVAVSDQLTTQEDTPVSFTLAFLTSNDTDADGDLCSVDTLLFSQPASGSVSLVSGNWTYTPALNFNGSDSFFYTIDDGHGGVATGTVNINVNAVNDPPVAVNDSGDTSGGPITISVLSNDSDIDGNTPRLSSLACSGLGTLTANGDGTVTYTPAAGFAGDDVATYTITDGLGGTSTATILITVRGGGTGGPTIQAVGDSYSLAEDTTFFIPLNSRDRRIDRSKLDLHAGAELPRSRFLHLQSG